MWLNAPTRFFYLYLYFPLTCRVVATRLFVVNFIVGEGCGVKFRRNYLAKLI